MKLPLYQIDAFTGRLFAGNPAAVCPLEEWLDASTMQAIAAENNLAETAFFVRRGDAYHLRWFTPEVEVDLCGHATLASAFVVFEYLDPAAETVRFETLSGDLTVRRQDGRLVMDFPSRPPQPCPADPALTAALVYESEDDVRSLAPDMKALAAVGHFAVCVTAPGRQSDFVSRFFAPASGVPEDPVTGSAHCALTPYWSRRLNKKDLHAQQVSARGGELFCHDGGERVQIAGQAVKYLEGFIAV